MDKVYIAEVQKCSPGEIARFWELEMAICWAALKYPHAFYYGCGRETMADWVNRDSELSFTAREIRNALMLLTEKGIFIKRQSCCGYSQFIPAVPLSQLWNESKRALPEYQPKNIYRNLRQQRHG